MCWTTNWVGQRFVYHTHTVFVSHSFFNLSLSLSFVLPPFFSLTVSFFFSYFLYLVLSLLLFLLISLCLSRSLSILLSYSFFFLHLSLPPRPNPCGPLSFLLRLSNKSASWKCRVAKKRFLLRAFSSLLPSLVFWHFPSPLENKEEE